MLLGAARRGRFEKRASLRVRVAAESSKRIETRYGFIVGAGLVSRFFERYVAAGAGGEVQAARLALRVFVGALSGSRFARDVLSPQHAIINVDGKPLPWSRFSLVCAATVPTLGLGLRVAHRASEDPARPHLVASGASPFELGVRAIRVPLGLAIGGRASFDGLVDKFTIRFPGDDAFVLDGDLVPAREIEVAAGPELIAVAPMARRDAARSTRESHEIRESARDSVATP